MSTLAQLVDQTLLNLQGDSLDQAEQTFLVGSINETATTFQVDEPTLISQGMVEIGDELIWVKSVDNSTGTVTTSTLGRGFRSTVAASHTSGAIVTNNPRYSRYRVKEALKTAIRNVYPDLYVVKTTEFPFVAVRNAYELPSDVDQVHKVTWESIGPSRVWVENFQWEFVPDADTTAFTTGKAIYLWDVVIPGRTVRVTYLAPPTVITLDGDNFSTTGLASTAEEAVIYGACYRLMGFVEAPRMQVSAIESSQRSQNVPPGASINTGKFFYSLYQDALQRERERMLRINPSPVYRRRRLI